MSAPPSPPPPSDPAPPARLPRAEPGDGPPAARRAESPPSPAAGGPGGTGCRCGGPPAAVRRLRADGALTGVDRLGCSRIGLRRAAPRSRRPRSTRQAGHPDRPNRPQGRRAAPQIRTAERHRLEAKEGTWQVDFYAGGTDRVQVVVDSATGEIRESWTGYQIAWQMARGYSGPVRPQAECALRWLPLAAIFLSACSTSGARCGWPTSTWWSCSRSGSRRSTSTRRDRRLRSRSPTRRSCTCSRGCSGSVPGRGHGLRPGAHRLAGDRRRCSCSPFGSRSTSPTRG